jgi:signal peptidase I
MYYVKRVIGLPGETIEGIDGYVYINGEKIEETYVKSLLEENFGPYTIPENCYFMMGDNRSMSFDSRLWENKYVSIDKIVGKAMFKYLSDFMIFNTPDYNIQE